MVGTVKLTRLLSLAWWICLPLAGREVMQAQHAMEASKEGAVAVRSGETQTAPTRHSSSHTPAMTQRDSLELLLLDIEIAKAHERLKETSFWKRLIPNVHISASLGLRNAVFIDPTTFTPFLVPRDAYRVTVSLSLSELLNRSQHSLAKLELERLMTERSYRLLQQIQSRATLQHYVTALDEEMACLHEERKIIDELLRFNQLRFEQGKIEFDVLMRSKLELLSVQKAMQRIQQQKSEVQLKILW